MDVFAGSEANVKPARDAVQLIVAWFSLNSPRKPFMASETMMSRLIGPLQAQLISNVRRNRGAERQGVGEVAVVQQVEISDQRGLPIIEVNEQRVVVRQPRRPQDARGGGKDRVEVANVGREACIVILTLKQVETAEHEPRIEKAAVHASVDALHEAQVGVEEQRGRVPGRSVGAGAGPLDCGYADVALEIGDAGGFVSPPPLGPGIVPGPGESAGPGKLAWM